MLKTLKNAPYKTFQTGNVSMEKMNIFEIFIRMFIDEVFLIVKKGLKCNYEIVEENVSYFKGKMKFAEQMKFNRFHKERNFIEHDVFTTNRPENRIIKATLLYLLKHSGVSKNRNDIKTLLNYFCDVEVSKDYKKDFSKYILDRNTKDYEVAMLWSKIFLMGKSFTSFAGSEVAYALLFPMETLFESYIATLLKRELVNTGYQISVQDKKYHLFDEPAKKFLMKPDIVITNKSEQSVYVMDTKWKILSENKPNYGIAQSDMYQMYAYQKKYSAANITLIYPKTDNLSGKQVIDFHSNDGVLIKIRFVDLFNIGKLEGFLD